MTDTPKPPMSSDAKTLAVIMVSYFTGPALLESVAAVLRDPSLNELILVDNGNESGLRLDLARAVIDDRRVRLLQGHGNIGFGRGCNYGAAMTQADYLLFLNPDAVITCGAARQLARTGQDLSAPWIVGAALQLEDGTEQRGARRRQVTPLSAIVTFLGLKSLGAIKGINRTDEPMPENAVPMPTVSGAAMLLDRASFERLGGFDERYFLHVEDIDICRRARLAGGDVYFQPNAIVKHYGATSAVSSRIVEFEKFKSFVLYFWTYSDAIWAKALCVLAVPLMAAIFLGRTLLKRTK